MISGRIRLPAMLVAAALGAAALAGGAGAQGQGESVPPGAAEQPAQTQDNWVVVCNPPEGEERRCTLLQNLAVQSGETQQRLLTVMVQQQPEGQNLMLLLSLPHGLFLPAGAQIQIDGGEPTKVVIQTSDASGSYAATELTPALLETLRRGQVLNVSMMSANQRGITVPVTLVGFTKGYAELTEAIR